MSKTYREHLIRAVVEFDKFMRELDLHIINLAMSGEFSEVNALFEEGDVMRLDIADFEDIADQNVQKLIKVFRLLHDVNSSIRNINAISSDEIDRFDDLPF
ncbi:hypothetical protein [Olivibacter sitiensis]|uniref:hypothetical protein n=1 Tax=Olivibacter sitiensis TaxID=376470 RepID=UPI00048630D7|nr:hypothetical protein [Olivibacter sitiensis]